MSVTEVLAVAWASWSGAFAVFIYTASAIDAIWPSLIAGVFLVTNTVLTIWLTHKLSRDEEEMKARRRRKRSNR